PDLVNIENYIYIVRHDDDMDVNMPNIADTALRTVGTVDVDRYDKIECDIRLAETVSPDQWTLSVTPNEVLIPNAAYYLILSKFTRPEFFSIEKTVSVGPSTVSLLVGNLATSENTLWTIEIISDSVLTSGSNIIVFSVLKDGLTFDASVTLDVKKENYTLSEEVELVFNADVPFLTGEQFTVETNAYTQLGETLIQDIETNINSDIIAPSQEITSERLNNEDIVKFYETSGWSRRVNDDSANTVAVGETSIASETKRLDTIIIDCGVEIDPGSIIDTVFNIDVDFAFNNYMLGNMGYFDDSKQYVIYYSIVDKNYIKLVVEENSDLVPSGLRYKLLPGV
ncbi:hypothetical protein N9242_00850, partial [Vicingaceae bacterium]|nr:hypothetical protein [Vicingaceae bacterium]